MKVVGIIPARYGSARFPGKPLADILGQPMIVRVYNRVSSIKTIDEIVVATDDERIAAVCQDYRIPYVMTSPRHPTGANRLQEVSESVNADFYLQLNGDEPLIDINAVEAAIPEDVPKDTEFGTNIITEIAEPSEVMDPSNIKVVFDKNYRALYMSRTPIPFPFKSLDFRYYKHVGIIGYNKKMLDFYKNSTPGKFEIIEGIDTLRFIDYGKELMLNVVNNCHTLSVDNPKDLDVVIRMIKENQYV